MSNALFDVPVPQSLFANPEVKPAVLQTWIRLRALAGAGGLIAACPLKELAWRVGKSKSTLHQHLTLLRLLGCLDFNWPESGLWAVSFNPLAEADRAAESAGALAGAPAQLSPPGPACAAPHASEIPDAKFANDASLSTSPLNRNLKRGAGARAPIPLFGFPPDLADGNGQQSRGRNTYRPSGAPPSPPAPAPSDPAAVFRAVFGFNVRNTQRVLLTGQVGDLKKWQATLEHWLMHGWNPKNLTGMLDLYRRGGPEKCHYCRNGEPAPAKAAVSQTQQAIKELYAWYR